MPTEPKTILITGGAGFIGSTVGSALIDAGYQVVVLDNLSTGREEFCTDRKLYVGDIADGQLIDRIVADNPGISAVVHCAASIVVPESVAEPIRYYNNNVVGTLKLVESLLRNGITRMLFSSSASIYGVAEDFTVDENSPIDPSSPYARTKAHVEGMLADICDGTDLRLISLRYFNPIGADPKMRTGLALEKPSHALGMILTRDAEGEPFTVTGDTWPTRDGSGVRDYIHVWDLAAAHVAAIDNFDSVVTGPDGDCTHRAINLGTGTGTTVFELVEAYNRVVGHEIAVEVGPPRPGDVAGAYAQTGRAEKELGWRATHSVDDGIRDTLRWFDRRGDILPDLAR
ncbi:UDP-glucose 4-epimerase GalE [Corynebacterium mendelii]|uniref:UDP-glucose 4-epimerase n=1 Tax=Corynebacterium mendelii TaxID=2765362 RepID=A0A939IY38_9CORY|nr:UDP-glucose 4-epimerase GalE [Corynebacterium mendelii]MBN9644723.1 UDP-glucose 4-epimerase GalE [Corynebacterium mendelii]